MSDKNFIFKFTYRHTFVQSKKNFMLQEHYSDYIIANTNGTNVQISHLFA